MGPALEISSYGDCQKLCQQKSECTRFTYSLQNKKCFMKNDTSNPLSDKQDLISGLATCPGKSRCFENVTCMFF